MRIENLEVYGIKAALRAMRNPMDSWDRSDSYKLCDYKVFSDNYMLNTEGFILGNNDKTLSQKLTKAGTEHCKHLRLIQVWVDMTLPRFVWVEKDTYRFVEKISCSTLHKLTSKELTQDDFEYEISMETLQKLNSYIAYYQTTKDKNTFLKLKNELPEGFLQKRTINTNYQQLLNIYNQRKSHKLPQWKVICDWILELPYFSDLTGIGYDKNIK